MPAELVSTVQALDAQLNNSATGRKLLNDQVLTPFRNCQLAEPDADNTIDMVIANRSAVIDALDALTPSNPTAVNLVSLLRRAMQFSLSSDNAWKAWIESQSYTDCPVSNSDDATAKYVSDKQATPAKQAFLNAYNPIAAQVGLPTWTGDEF